MEDHRSLISEYGLGEYSKLITDLVRPTIHIHRTPIEQMDLVANESRLGGSPHLPPGMAWPMWRGHPLGFLASFRLSDLAPFDLERMLPPHGLLYFWYALGDGPWGFDPAEAGFFKVDYIEDESIERGETRLPVELFSREDMKYWGFEAPRQPSRVTVSRGMSLPDMNWIRDFVSEDHPLLRDWERYMDMVDELHERVLPEHRLLGHSSPVQGPMEKQCQLVTHGFFCGNGRYAEDPTAMAIAKDSLRWRLLLQLDTDGGSAQWMWGDIGKLYFWIPDHALRMKQFDTCWMVLQCG